jgi:hypothetical protein
MTYDSLCRSSSAELARLFAAGAAPKAADLAGWEWRGCNQPWYASLLGIKKFIKGFFEGPNGVEGYNIPVRQNGVAAPWQHKPSDQAPRRFGFYRVLGDDGRHPNSLLLDYGASARNLAVQPERLLRDYLVVVPGTELVLGKAYLAFGSAYAPASWFVLERLRRTSWKPDDAG